MSLPAVDALLAVQKRLDRLARGLTSPPAVSRLLEPPVLAVAEDPFVRLVPGIPGPLSAPATPGRAEPGDVRGEGDAQPDRVPDGMLGQFGDPNAPPWRKTSRPAGLAPADVERSPRLAPGPAPAPGFALAPSPEPEAARSYVPEPARRLERAEAIPAENAGSAAFRPYPAPAPRAAAREVPTAQIRRPSGRGPNGLKTPTTGTQRAGQPRAHAVRAVPAPAVGDPERSGENTFRVSCDPARGAAVLRAHLAGVSAADPAAPRGRPGGDAPGTATSRTGRSPRPTQPSDRAASAPPALPDVQRAPDIPGARDIPGAPAAAAAPAGIGPDPTDAALDELYAALAGRLRLDVLRTYGTGQG
ncbi:MAG: hypothetical protein ACXVW7_10535 [Trebonia sp.]